MIQRVFGSKRVRVVTIVALVAVLVGGLYVLNTRPSGRKVSR